jgi:anti-sigma regulatory factor (Ser/Thr protein kinase)
MPIPATSSASAAGLRGEPLAHAEVDLTGLLAPQVVARHLVHEVLADEDGSWRDVIVLVADELVGNAHRHVEAGKPIGMAVDLYDWGAVVQVEDSGRDITAISCEPKEPALEDEGGRGLFLIDTLASSWGVRPTDTGKSVVALFLHQPAGGGR